MESTKETERYRTFNVGRKTFKYWLGFDTSDLRAKNAAISIFIKANRENELEIPLPFERETRDENGTIGLLNYGKKYSSNNSFAKNKSFQDWLYKELKQDLKKHKWQSVKSYIEKIVFPYYIIKRYIRNNILKYSDHSLLSKVIYLKSAVDKISKCDTTIDFSIEEVAFLNEFFNELSKKNNLTFLNNFYRKWNEKKDFTKVELLNKLLIYCVFFAEELEGYLLTFIQKAKESAYISQNTEHLSRLLIGIQHKSPLMQPLKLSHVEVKHILKEVFRSSTHIDTIKKYCKEMNLETYNPKKGHKIERKDIKHPYLTEEFKLKVKSFKLFPEAKKQKI